MEEDEEIGVDKLKSIPQASIPTDRSSLALQKKHAAMLDRLNARHVNQSRPPSSDPGITNPVQSFLDRFSQSKRSIESSIDRCRADFGVHGSGPRLKLDFEKVSSAVADLEKFVAESSYLLPPYEVRSALKTIADVKEAVEKVSEEMLPRRKFAFRNKPTKRETESVEKVKEVNTAVPVQEGSLNLLVAKETPGFRNREGVTIVKDFRVFNEKEGDFSLCDLNSCKVYLKGRIRALFVHRLRNCHVFVGPVLGSVLIEDVQNCVFMLASHQIRIHEATETDFYLRVRSRPIIEDCNGVRFGPYKLSYDGIEDELRESGLAEETGNWESVDDFRWLKATPSPNWRALEEKEWTEVVSISDVQEPG